MSRRLCALAAARMASVRRRRLQVSEIVRGGVAEAAGLLVGHMLLAVMGRLASMLHGLEEPNHPTILQLLRRFGQSWKMDVTLGTGASG